MITNNHLHLTQLGVPGHAVPDQLGHNYHRLLRLPLASPAHHGPYTGDDDVGDGDGDGGDDDNDWLSRPGSRRTTSRDNLSRRAPSFSLTKPLPT